MPLNIFFFLSVPLKPVSYACIGEGLKLGMREQQGQIVVCEEEELGDAHHSRTETRVLSHDT